MFGQAVDIDDDPTTPELPAVIIGILDNPPLTDSFTAFAGTGSFALTGYDLTTSIGPISSALLGVVGSDLILSTTLGPLSFTNNIQTGSDGTFTATVGVTAVPEPATLFLFGSGLAAVAARRRARR